MTQQVRIKQLGLAAYVSMKGAKLLSTEGKVFVFESEKSEKEWQVEYSNSCCQAHDARVCQLRNMLKG